MRGRWRFVVSGPWPSPSLLRLQESPSGPLGRSVLYTLLTLLAALLGWAAWGQLDIVAAAYASASTGDPEAVPFAGPRDRTPHQLWVGDEP